MQYFSDASYYQQGAINGTTGANGSTLSNRVRTVSYATVLPGEVITFHGDGILLWVYQYEADGTYVSSTPTDAVSDYVYTVPEGVGRIRLVLKLPSNASFTPAQLGDTFTLTATSTKESFTFADRSSDTFYAHVFDYETNGAPRRQYDEITVPGRNGVLYMDGKRYENRIHSYDVIITRDFLDNYEVMRNFLLSQVGYKRLEDSMHPDEFYKAIYRNDFVMTVTNHRDMGKIRLEFERMPQRFLKSGETTITLTADGTVTNPSDCEARPLLKIYGTGTVGIGHNAITVNSSSSYTYVDCETMEAYYGTTSKNSSIEIQDTDFPVLGSGDTGITLGDGITKVEITPRWWRL